MNEHTTIRTQALEGLARIDTILMREFLGDKGVRPEPSDCKWVCNAPNGPSRIGVAIVNATVHRYCEENVTTSNAHPMTPGKVGIYVRRALR